MKRWGNRNGRRMADLLTSPIRPGRVILLHDAIITNPCAKQDPIPNGDRGPMLLALKILLDRLAHKFRFATIPEMFQLGRPIRRIWFQVPMTSDGVGKW